MRHTLKRTHGKKEKVNSPQCAAAGLIATGLVYIDFITLVNLWPLGGRKAAQPN